MAPYQQTVKGLINFPSSVLTDYIVLALHKKAKSTAGTNSWVVKTVRDGGDSKISRTSLQGQNI